MIDVSCFVGTGPLASTSVAELEATLRKEGFTSAAVSPMAELFGGASAAPELSTFFRYVPIVDPRRPRPLEGLTAVRIAPASHGYPAEAAIDLKEQCGRAGVTLVVQLRIADPRNVPADLNLGGVPDVRPLLRAAPEVPVLVAGARVGELQALLSVPSVHAEVSLLEEPDVLRRAVNSFGPERLLIGTHAPFLTPAAARLKVSAARLNQEAHALITHDNAIRLGL